MTLTEKKKLAVDLMGWKHNSARTFIENDGQFTLKRNYSDYNPDTNPAQFKEVLERLTPEQREALAEKLWNEERGIALGEEFEAFIWISNHMPEVITAILEVISSDGGK